MSNNQPANHATKQAPSSSQESGRGNSGEGKDPPEGLYAPDKQKTSTAGGKPASPTPTGNSAGADPQGAS